MVVIVVVELEMKDIMEKLIVGDADYHPYICIVESNFSEHERCLNYFGFDSYDDVIRWIIRQGDILCNGSHYEGCESYKFIDVSCGKPLKIYERDYARIAQEMERIDDPKKAEKNAWWYEDMLNSDDLLYG